MKATTARTIGATAIAVALISVESAVADTQFDVCGLGDAVIAQSLQPMLDGYWEVDMGPGVLSMQGRTMPLPPGEPDVASITSDDASMIISGGVVFESFPLHWETGAEWSFDLSDDSVLDPDDILDDDEQSILAGCPVEDLPRLFSQGEYVDPESGQPVSFELYLRVISPSVIYGMVIGRSGGGTAQRAVSLTR